MVNIRQRNCRRRHGRISNSSSENEEQETDGGVGAHIITNSLILELAKSNFVLELRGPSSTVERRKLSSRKDKHMEYSSMIMESP
jgi:hypothetical protein